MRARARKGDDRGNPQQWCGEMQCVYALIRDALAVRNTDDRRKRGEVGGADLPRKNLRPPGPQRRSGEGLFLPYRHAGGDARSKQVSRSPRLPFLREPLGKANPGLPAGEDEDRSDAAAGGGFDDGGWWCRYGGVRVRSSPVLRSLTMTAVVEDGPGGATADFRRLCPRGHHACRSSALPDTTHARRRTVDCPSRCPERAATGCARRSMGVRNRWMPNDDTPARCCRPACRPPASAVYPPAPAPHAGSPVDARDTTHAAGACNCRHPAAVATMEPSHSHAPYAQYLRHARKCRSAAAANAFARSRSDAIPEEPNWRGYHRHPVKRKPATVPAAAPAPPMRGHQ